MNRALFLILILLCLVSCQKNKRQSDLTYCKIESQIETYPDSSFFSDITCMVYNKGNVYVLDKKRGDIVALSDDLQRMEYVTHHGAAPYETTWPFTFNVQYDTVYVVDFGTKSMKKFYGGSFCGDFLLSNANENRFSLRDSLIYLSANTDSTSFLLIDTRHPDRQVPKGEVVQEKTAFKTVISNRKHILYAEGKGIFSVSDCYPYIDQYTFDGRYVRRFDISSIPVIKAAMEISEKQANREKSVYIYIRDAYLADGHLYLLCSSRTDQNEYKVNTILDLSVDEDMKLVSTYMLPHDIYSSFCVSDTYLFAAQEVDETTIEKFKLRDDAER